MAPVFIKRAKLLAKNKRKFKNKRYKHYFHSSNNEYVQYNYFSNSKEINSIAIEVFGSLYFNPSKD